MPPGSDPEKDWKRLTTYIELSGQFDLLVIGCAEEDVLARLRLRLKAYCQGSGRRFVEPRVTSGLSQDPLAWIAELRAEAPGGEESAPAPVYFLAFPAEGEKARFLGHRLNEQRDNLRRELRGVLCLAGVRDFLSWLPAEAPDLWSARAQTFEFVALAPSASEKATPIPEWPPLLPEPPIDLAPWFPPLEALLGDETPESAGTDGPKEEVRESLKQVTGVAREPSLLLRAPPAGVPADSRLAGDGLKARGELNESLLAPPEDLNNAFEGREDALAQLHAQLVSRHAVLIVGPAGIGKTRLAAEYARRFADRYPGGVFWVARGLPQRLAMRAITHAAGLDTATDSKEDAPERMWDAVANLQHTLLVIDDLPQEPEDPHRWLPPRELRDTIDLLATADAALPGWPDASAAPFVLGPLAEQDAERLLVGESRSRDLPEVLATRALAARLAGSPLSLTLATICFREGSATHYPQLDEVLEREMHGEHTTEPALHALVRLLWRRYSWGTQALLKTLALAASAPMAIHLLDALVARVRSARLDEQCLAEAVRSQLIVRHGREHVAIHPLVAQVIRSWISEPEARDLIDAMTAEVGAKLESKEAVLASIEEEGLETLALHVETLLRATRQFPLDTNSVPLSLALALRYLRIGRPAMAEFWALRAFEDAQLIQEERAPFMAVSATTLGLVSTRLHRMGGAYFWFFSRAVQAIEEVVGQHHPFTAICRNNLAMARAEAGQPKHAQSLLEEALMMLRNGGAQAIQTAAVRSNLGSVALALGDRERARTLIEEAVREYTSVFGADHPALAQLLPNLAAFHLAEGRPGKARPLLERAIELLQRRGNVRALPFIQSLALLGMLEALHGEPTQALGLLERATRLTEQELNRAHPIVAFCEAGHQRAMRQLRHARPAVGQGVRAHRYLSGERRPLRVYVSFARADESLLEELETHLGMLRRQGLITWNERRIEAGTEWKYTELEKADLVLLLVSPDFVASDYCYGIEVLRALERHAAGETRVIPIIVRPVDWSATPFARLQPLPHDAKPVVSRPSRDGAWLDVSRGIRQIVESMQASGAHHPK